MWLFINKRILGKKRKFRYIFNIDCLIRVEEENEVFMYLFGMIKEDKKVFNIIRYIFMKSFMVFF